MLRYQNNAFRILGLTSDASIKEIIQRVNEIKVKMSLSLDVAHDFDFTWMGNIDRSEQNVIHALQRLENPISRLEEEIFWFWTDTDTDKKAISCLIKGDRQAAHELWKAITVYDQINDDTISAFVNQMILSHSSVIGKEIVLKYTEDACSQSKNLFCSKCGIDFETEYKFCTSCGNKLKPKSTDISKRNINLSDTHWTNWRFAINRVSMIATKESFWSRIKQKAEKIDDPRLSTLKLKEIRNNFFHDITKPNLSFLSQSLASKDYERTRKHAGLLNGSSIPNDVLRRGFNNTLNSQISLIKRHCTTANKEVSDFEKIHIKPIKVLAKIYSKLEKNVNDPIKEGNLVDFNSISDFGLSRDALAGEVKNIAIILNNLLIHDKTIVGEKREWGFKKAYEMIRKAYEYAGSQYTKQKFSNDEEVIKSNMEMEGIENSYYESPPPVQSEPEEKEYEEPEKPAPKSKKHTSQPKPQPSSSGGGWKAFFLIVALVIVGSYFSGTDDTTNNETSSSKVQRKDDSGILKGDTYKKSSTATSAYQLKTKIDELAESIKEKESRLSVMDASISSKNKAMGEIKTKINELETKLRKAWFGKDKITTEQNNLVQSHNNLLELHNKELAEYQKLYAEYERDLNAHNKLVNEYNNKFASSSEKVSSSKSQTEDSFGKFFKDDTYDKKSTSTSTYQTNEEQSSMPANSQLDYTGNNWECRDGYYKSGNRCLAVQMPANSQLDYTGNNWECRDGYYKSGSTCVSVQMPANSQLDYTGNNWECRDGYYKSGSTCVSVQMPANSQLDYTGNNWECRDGYYKSGNRCLAVQMPANSQLDYTGNNWECRDGYYKSGNRCLAVQMPANSQLDYTGNNWECRDGFKRIGSECISLTSRSSY